MDAQFESSNTDCARTGSVADRVATVAATESNGGGEWDRQWRTQSRAAAHHCTGRTLAHV